MSATLERDHCYSNDIRKRNPDREPVRPYTSLPIENYDTVMEMCRHAKVKAFKNV